MMRESRKSEKTNNDPEIRVVALWQEFLQGRYENGYISLPARDKLIELGAPESFKWMYLKVGPKPRKNDTKSLIANLESRINTLENSRRE